TTKSTLFPYTTLFRSLGNHEDGRKRSMAARRLIEGRNPHETMNAGFARKETVSIFTGKLDRRRLDAGFFSGSLIKNLGRHSPARSEEHTSELQSRGHL